MAKPLSKKKADEILAGDRKGDAFWKAIKRLPEDVDVELAVGAIDWLFERPWMLGRQCQELPASVIRAVLGPLETIAAAPDSPSRYVAMITSVMVDKRSGDEELRAAWRRALVVLLELDLSYAWGSKKKRERFRALAQDAEAMKAIRAVAVGIETPRLDVLGVLAADGSEESIDALMPHIDKAQNDGPRLEALLDLRTHANPDSEILADLLDSLEARLHQRSLESPARALAKVIGIEIGKVFWFRASVNSEELSGTVSKFQGGVYVDTRDTPWFRVHMFGDGERTVFTSDESESDGHGLGSCDAADIPAWIARAASKLGATWRVGVSSSVRGKKRDRIADWIRSGS